MAMRADKLEGPWSQPFFVSPAYTRTFSTQSGFSWRIEGTKKTTHLYMGDQVIFSKWSVSYGDVNVLAVGYA